MSQSDYIKYKRTSTVLKDNTLLPVLTPNNYTEFKQYSVENTIPISTAKLFYKRLIPSGMVRVFDMDKRVTNCPTFPMCKNTNTRTNRVPLSTIYFTPKYVAKYVKHPSTEKTACNCKPNSKYTDDHICKCKTSV